MPARELESEDPGSMLVDSKPFLITTFQKEWSIMANKRIQLVVALFDTYEAGEQATSLKSWDKANKISSWVRLAC
jgi:hypothetical protein